MLLLHHPRRVDHRRVGHGDVAGLLREQPPRHHPPRRAARCRKEAVFRRDLFQIVPCFLDRADIRADGNLFDRREAQRLHRRDELRRRDILAELPGERRRDDGDDLVAFQNGTDDLIDLTLVDDRAEWAADEALAAGHAAVIIDTRLAVFVYADGVHPACGLTGPFDHYDRVIRAGRGAFAAFDALFLIDAALAVDEVNRALGTDALTRRGKTALAESCRLIPFRGTGVAGVGNDVDERRLIVLLGDGRVTHALAQHRPLLHGLERQSHCQPHALSRDGPLEKNGLAVARVDAGDDFIRNILHLGIVSGVGHSGHLGKDLFSDVGDE